MPTYEFYCSSCRRKFEAVRPMALASESAPCPRCEAAGQRVFSVVASYTHSAEGYFEAHAGSGRGCVCGAGGCGGACSR